jgi:hypothetical protein
LGIGSVVLIRTTGLLKDGEKTAKVSTNVGNLAEDLVRRGSQMLTDTADKNNKRNQAVCRFVNSDAKAPGVGSIFINLSGHDKWFNSKNYSNYFNGWKESSSGNCKKTGKIGKCFEIDSATSSISLSVDKIEEMGVVGMIDFIPVNVNPKQAGVFEPIPGAKFSQSFDVKSVGFMIEGKVTYKGENGKRVEKSFNDFVWAPSVGVCDYELSNGKNVRLSLSGTGASDPEGLTVYNRSGFTGNKLEPIEVSFRKTQAQRGVVTDNGRFITTDRKSNIYGSCNEVRFRCRQENSKDREFEAVRISSNLKFNSNNSLFNAPKANVKVQLEMLKGGKEGVAATKNVEAQYYVDNKKIKENEFVLTGSHDLVTVLHDPKDELSANGLCRSICQADSAYNTLGNGYTEQVSPYLNFSFLDFNRTRFTYATSQALGCTACYMKNCDQFGLGTFGPMDSMPSQPLDSVLPECSLREPASVVQSLAPMSEVKKIGAPWGTGAPKCILAKYEQSTNRLVLRAEDCSQNHPVMCYNFGHFILARDVTSSGQNLAKTNYNDSSKRCAQMGKETASINELHEFMGINSLPIPKSKDGKKYEFINHAGQGIFLAPQIDQDLRDFDTWRKAEGISINTEFWVALQRDGEGVVARPPFAPELSKNENHAIFFDGKGKLIHEQYEASLGLNSGGSGELAYLLAHHIRHKGLYGVKPNNPASGREFAFLCRKKNSPYEFFVSKKKDKDWTSGVGACQSEAGNFIAPNTSLGWVKAFALTASFDQKHPFPNPKIKKSSEIPMVWVGIKKAASVPNEELGWIYGDTPGWRDIGVTSLYSPDTSDGDIRLVDGKGRYRDPRGKVEGDKIDNSDIVFSGGSSFGVRVDGEMISVNINTGSADATISLADIVTKFNSSTDRVKMSVEAAGPKVHLVVRARNVSIEKIEVDSNSTSNKLGLKSKSWIRPRYYQICNERAGNIREIFQGQACSGRKMALGEFVDTKGGELVWNILAWSEDHIYSWGL